MGYDMTLRGLTVLCPFEVYVECEIKAKKYSWGNNLDIHVHV